MKKYKHISYNPYFVDKVDELIPDEYVLEKVIPVTEYEWVLVCKKSTD